MRMIAALVALVTFCRPDAGRAQQVFPAHEVAIDVSVPDAAHARVRERYLLDGPGQSSTFEFLESACAAVGPVSASIDDRRLAVDASRRGPWTMLRASDERDIAAGRQLIIEYDVRMDDGGEVVPIVLPSAALSRAGESRGADVALRVDFSPSLIGPSVVVPRLARDEVSHTWQGRLPAIPSIIGLALGSGRGCDRVLPGSTGGLEWRFWVFLATMGIWVPVYFWRFGTRA